MTIYPEFDRLKEKIEQQGIDVNCEVHGFAYPGVLLAFPGTAIQMCLSGTARIIHDMQELTIGKNNLWVMMPGHYMQAVSCSDDFTYSRTVISSAILEDLKPHLLNHDFDKFNSFPSCQLTDAQADRIMAIAKLLSAIAMHDYADLQLQRQMLLMQLSVGYEFINFYRKEQDRRWRESQKAAIYTHFCELVAEHYREQRNVQFYAEQFGYSPRYFSKLFLKVSNGISATDYISRYVCTQAKRIMETHPRQSVKTTALQLGFSTSGNFCRYFKRVTGIYPQEYKKMEKPTAVWGGSFVNDFRYAHHI